MLSMAPPVEHIPVLVDELLAGLGVVPGGVYADCNAGGGGHAEAVLEASSPGGRLLGIDLDLRAIRATERRLERFAGSWVLVNDNFTSLGAVAARHGFAGVNGVYFDLGFSSLQLEEADRGFSFQREDPLDMRFSQSQGRNAAELINSGTAEELARVLRSYGEEPRSRAIARRIVAERPLETTGQLTRLVQRVAQRPHLMAHLARVFQALRIWVNDELASLERALPQALGLLAPGGRVAVISYHSLEDRIVKTFFRHEATDCICPPRTPVCICGHTATVRLVTKKIITPSKQETESNPRSRSAKLRIAQKL